MLVNRQHKLGKNDAPTDLVTIESVLSADIVKVKYSGTKADRTATEALGRMLSAAIADGPFQLPDFLRLPHIRRTAEARG